jgi:hypothetical protein
MQVVPVIPGSNLALTNPGPGDPSAYGQASSPFQNFSHPIWQPDPLQRREFLATLKPNPLDPHNPDLQLTYIALSDPVHDRRSEALAALALGLYTPLVERTASASELRAALRTSFSHLANPLIVGLSEDRHTALDQQQIASQRDPRVDAAHDYDPRRSLGHTRLMGLQLVQQTEQLYPRCCGLLAQYLASLHQNEGFLKRHVASRLAREAPDVLQRPLSELPPELSVAPPDQQLWRGLQVIRTQLSWHPDWVEQKAWARSFMVAWEAGCSIWPDLRRVIL